MGSKPWILPSSRHAFLSMLCCLLFNLWGCVYLALCCGKEVSLALGLQDGRGSGICQQRGEQVSEADSLLKGETQSSSCTGPHANQSTNLTQQEGKGVLSQVGGVAFRPDGLSAAESE